MIQKILQSIYRQFDEIQDVISGKIKGRESNKERISSYNICLGLHDMVYASKIYQTLKGQSNEIKLYEKRKSSGFNRIYGKIKSF